MQKIGFGEQPYLVYRHFDAGHPHIHIVSLKVRADGTRIDTNNIERNQSEKARKEIENDYGLVKAENMKAKPYELKSAYTARVQYGKSESRRGVPIKASSFHNKSNLKYLEEKFVPNEAARQAHKLRFKNSIDLALLKEPKKSLETLVRALEKEGINTVLRQNKEGIIYGLTYVDDKTKCVFNGSDLGKQYSAKSIMERCKPLAETPLQKQEFVKQPSSKTGVPEQPISAPGTIQKKDGTDLLETLLQPEHTSGYVPNELTGKGRKKRKKGISKRL